MCVLDNKIEDELQTMRRCGLTSNASGIAYGRGATQALLLKYLSGDGVLESSSEA